MTALEELLYDLALRSLERQERQVAELRARTGTLLAAAALSASFLGATAVDRDGLSPSVLLSIGALLATIGLALSVLVPHDLTFTLSLGFRRASQFLVGELLLWIAALAVG